MVYRTFLILGFCALTASLRAEDFQPFAGLKPVAVLVQTDPWATIMGAETPRIAIYENGEVIYSRQDSGRKAKAYLHANLGFDGMSAVLEQMKTVADVPGPKSSYSISEATDRGSAEFYLRVDDREIAVAVRGLTPESEAHARKNTGIPIELLNLYDYLRNVEFTESEPWRPLYVEAMIWPYDDAPGTAILWPATWPGLDSPRARQREHGWSIFLDESREEELDRFLASRKEKDAVEIGGRKWSIAHRPVFPSEPVWRKVFSRIGNG